jgi:hypothetical protein
MQWHETAWDGCTMGSLLKESPKFRQAFSWVAWMAHKPWT